MTSSGVLQHVAGAYDVTSMWRRSQKPRRCIWVHVGEIDGRTSQVLQIDGLQGRQSSACNHNPTQESRILAMLGKGFEAVVHALWRMQMLLEAEFLGFGCERLWNTSVVLVSSGQAWLCIDLKGRHGLLRLCSQTQWQDSDGDSWKLCDGLVFRVKNNQGYCGSMLCMYESSLLCRDVCFIPRMKFGSNTLLNILGTRCIILCCICQSGCRRGNIEQEYREHEGYVVQPCRPTFTEESLKGYMFIM